VKKFGDMISTLGADVLRAIAEAGPENQVRTAAVKLLNAVHAKHPKTIHVNFLS
jgi:hypothetical protein